MLVIDASATVALLASQDGLEPFAHLDLVAPALLWSEVTSVLRETRWRGEISGELATAAFERLLAAPISRRASADLYREAVAVAQELGWAKTYDAEYVALARITDSRLMTQDVRLRRRATGVVDVVTPDDVVP